MVPCNIVDLAIFRKIVLLFRELFEVDKLDSLIGTETDQFGEGFIEIGFSAGIPPFIGL
jgi:hypothetical protein